MSPEERPEIVDVALARWPERFPMVVLEEDGTVSWASAPLHELLGMAPEEVIGRNVVELVHPDDVADAVGVMVHNFVRERERGEAPEPRFLFEVRVRRHDGSWCTVELSGVEQRRADGSLAVVLCVRDFRQRHLLDDLLGVVAGGAPLDDVLGAAADAIAFVVPGGRVALVTVAAGEPLVVGGSAWPEAAAALTGEVREEREDGAVVPARVGRWMLPLGGPSRGTGAVVVETAQAEPVAFQAAWIARVGSVVGLAVERAATEARLRRLALVDPLTEVANRAELARQLEAACRAGAVGVAVVDLDRFKAVNDLHGHAVGDAFLVEVARRLLRHARPGDVVGRLGGDEFALVYPGLDDPEVADAIARRLVDALADPVHLDGLLLDAAASVGLALGRSPEPDALLHHADVLLYEAKRLGGRRHLVAVS